MLDKILNKLKIKKINNKQMPIAIARNAVNKALKLIADGFVVVINNERGAGSLLKHVPGKVEQAVLTDSLGRNPL